MRNGGFKTFYVILGIICGISSIAMATFSNDLNSIKACSTCSGKTSDCSRVTIVSPKKSPPISCCSSKISRNTSNREHIKHNSRRRK